MTEFAALAQAFGPWVALLIWAGIGFFREWKTKGNDVKEAYAAHAEDLRKFAGMAERQAGTMVRVNDTLLAMNARLQRLEDRIDSAEHDRDTDEAIVPAARGHR